MDLRVIGTGSSGNAYLLRQGDDSLLLEAGLRWPEILPSLPAEIRNVKGCLITHEHKDHCKSVAQVMRHGIPTVMSSGTWQAILKSDRLSESVGTNKLLLLRAGDVIRLPPYTVMAVSAMHDAAMPLAYIIRHDGNGETVLYATDTYMLPNRYPGINHWLVECNYTLSKAEELLKSPEKAPLYDRLMRSHMSLERLVEALRVNDLRRTRTIVLIHISNERGDSDLMQKTVQEATHIRTIAAVSGMDIDLGGRPF